VPDTRTRMEVVRPVSLILSGKEFISADPLGASVLASLSALASRRPVLLNGVRLSAQELAELAEEARRTDRALWVGASPRDAAR
jgi:hypothetical protein